MISGNRDEAWSMYHHVWPISEGFTLGWSGGTWPACCHWLNTGKVDGPCPIMSVLIQSYPCDTWFVCSILRELAVSNLGQLLFCLSITWPRYATMPVGICESWLFKKPCSKCNNTTPPILPCRCNYRIWWLYRRTLVEWYKQLDLPNDH